MRKAQMMQSQQRRTTADSTIWGASVSLPNRLVCIDDGECARMTSGMHVSFREWIGMSVSPAGRRIRVFRAGSAVLRGNVKSRPELPTPRMGFVLRNANSQSSAEGKNLTRNGVRLPVCCGSSSNGQNLQSYCSPSGLGTGEGIELQPGFTNLDGKKHRMQNRFVSFLFLFRHPLFWPRAGG